MAQKSEDILGKYLPEGTFEMVIRLLRSEPVELKIKAPRKTKFGDYRFPNAKGRHRISVNSNLNTYAFLITLLHEMAHLKAFKQYGRNIRPHGKEWQKTFLDICTPFLNTGTFPADVAERLFKSLKKGRASSCTDIELFRTLKIYDPKTVTHVEDLNENDIFSLDNKMVFKKGTKARKRYKCVNMQNGRTYMIHPLAEVTVVKPQNIDQNV